MFKSLKDILPGTIEELGISEQLKRAAVFAAWRGLAADLPAHARIARPIRFQRGTLVVEASSSAAMHELHMRTPQLMRDLNTKLARPLVTKLEFRVRGRRPTSHTSSGTALQSAPQTPPKPAITSDDPDRDKRLRQAIDLIENPTVREQALARLAASEEQESDRCEQCGTHTSAPGLCPLCQAHDEQKSGQ
ncbi:MAG: DUF721 domain-containing protein [Chloroflexota bacterium]|nr:DUF721 domain-containing protein [Chloroflexota bacterium]MDE2839995.1 DUF721 domain-containing protein [Chloroflexota bacterium]MDE2931092.1 DUF721 domain-containing protein [Chloroflexota bacterium]